MATYTITLTDAENDALGVVAFSQDDWIQNVVKERCRIAMEEIIQTAVTNFLAVGEPIPGTREAIIERALELGLVKLASASQTDTQQAEQQQV